MIRSMVLLALVPLVLAGCDAAGNRPDESEWRTVWDQVRADIPDRSELDVADPLPVCQQTLGALRGHQPLLAPSPARAVDAAVEGWMEVADETFFECPPRSGELQGFDEAYQEMARFEREIETGLR